MYRVGQDKDPRSQGSKCLHKVEKGLGKGSDKMHAYRAKILQYYKLSNLRDLEVNYVTFNTAAVSQTACKPLYHNFKDSSHHRPETMFADSAYSRL